MWLLSYTASGRGWDPSTSEQHGWLVKKSSVMLKVSSTSASLLSSFCRSWIRVCKSIFLCVYMCSLQMYCRCMTYEPSPQNSNRAACFYFVLLFSSSTWKERDKTVIFISCVKYLLKQFLSSKRPIIIMKSIIWCNERSFEEWTVMDWGLKFENLHPLNFL